MQRVYKMFFSIGSSKVTKKIQEGYMFINKSFIEASIKRGIYFTMWFLDSTNCSPDLFFSNTYITGGVQMVCYLKD